MTNVAIFSMDESATCAIFKVQVWIVGYWADMTIYLLSELR